MQKRLVCSATLGSFVTSPPSRSLSRRPSISVPWLAAGNRWSPSQSTCGEAEGAPTNSTKASRNCPNQPRREPSVVALQEAEATASEKSCPPPNHETVELLRHHVHRAERRPHVLPSTFYLWLGFGGFGLSSRCSRVAEAVASASTSRTPAPPRVRARVRPSPGARA